MIKNIVFDMGGVLIRFDRRYFIEHNGVAPEDAPILMREVFLSLEWAQLDRGTLTDEQASEIICARIPAHLHEAARRLVSFWDRPIMPIEGMYELVEELKSNGYGIYLLSNASLRQPEYWPRIPASRFFDGTLISAHEGLVKPQPEIYRRLCERFELKPEECFFIDDLPINAEGAVYSGMSAAVFHGDAAEMRQKLRAAGVNVKAE